MTLFPRGLGVPLEPLCKSARNPVKKDCKAAVPEFAVAGVDMLLAPVPEEDAVLDGAGVAVVPPKSLMSLVNAEFRLDKLFDDRLEGDPPAAEFELMTWLLLNSLMREESSAARPCGAYCAIPVPAADEAAAVAGVAVAGVVTGAVVTGAVDAGAVDTDRKSVV